MATKSILKRGFKAQAERLAKKYKEELDIHPCNFLCAFKLAEHLRIPVYIATEFLTTPEDLKHLSGKNGNTCEWSALTMPTKMTERIIIYNPFHSIARQQSDMMHELAHIICKHERKTTEYDFELPIGLREYNKEQEEEAKCLGSTLQLSTPCLLWANKRNMSIEEIAEYFNASKDMVIYRRNMTGISRMSYNKFK